MPRPFDVRSGQRAVFDALLDARARHGGGKAILEDQDRKPLTYTDLIRAAFALGRKIAALTEPGERVGVLLPTSAGVVVTFFALHAFGRVPVMLNFTAGVRNLKRALQAAGVKRMLTSHRFLETAKLDDPDRGARPSRPRSPTSRTCAPPSASPTSSTAWPPACFRACSAATAKPTDPGVILFTSGSFGAPQGRGAEPGEPALQRRADRRPHRPRSGLGVVQPAADLPLLRPDRRACFCRCSPA